ncbi:MAG: crossover junction endodeoxyribonuclease RuvC, partial [Petrotogales bacterium]
MSKNSRRIIGIDPGFGILGYGLIDINGVKISPVTYGIVQTKPGDPIPERLIQIYDELKTVITEYEPDEAAVEELFFFRNVTTAIQVGEARGVVLLVLRQLEIPIYEYTPHQVKQAVTGYGKAEK